MTPNTGSDIERNLGVYLSSATATSSVTSNYYNYTLYSGLVGNFVTG